MDEPLAPRGTDKIRDQLLDAAVQVFARDGYEGTKIMDIVRESGLSAGAVYGRFTSKNELLREAVIRSAGLVTQLAEDGDERVADVIARAALVYDTPLSVNEAVRLEAHVAARREPEVAHALQEASEAFRTSVRPFVDAAIADGTLDEGVDPEAVLFLVRAVQLGLLVGRAAGIPTPDRAGWAELVGRVLVSFGAPSASPPPSSPAPSPPVEPAPVAPSDEG
jgi:AcrR family transcriptional regulator